MSKFKIEKVEHSFINPEDVCCLIDYYPFTGNLYQFNYHAECFAKTIARTDGTIGIWRIKSLKNKTN